MKNLTDMPFNEGRGRSLVEEILGLFLHLAIAVVGGLVAFLLIAVFLRPALVKLGIHQNEAAGLGIYNPEFWGPSILIGFFVNRLVRHRSAYWIGAVGILYLCGIVAWELSVSSHSEYINQITQGHAWRYEFVQFFTPYERKCAESECLGQAFGTIPTLNSIAYSIGAWFGFRSTRKTGGKKRFKKFKTDSAL